MFSYLKRIFLGAPLNPLHPQIRRHVALITLLAWVGLGADPLSSSCYGPEQTYLALGQHTHLALYIVVLVVMTIFIISIGYNQVIELFPSGGGGYKVASKLLHPYVGLVSGAALIVDYVLTITVSIASGADAVFSLVPIWWSAYKLPTEALAIIFLLTLNLRGVKEAIQTLLPIFLGFIVIHLSLIIYGITAHSQGLTMLAPIAMHETRDLIQSVGLLSMIGIILHAYSLGSGTYTGLEAVSNNVQRLAEPRIITGKRTTFCMAASLSVMAGGIILLYLLWDVKPVPGQTLNAVVFHSILGSSWLGELLLIITLGLEAGLLFVAANAGFAAGPNVLANMAVDGWVPNRFRHLSNRLVEQNGLIIFGIAALIILIWTTGSVALLVVLYSINVFITFSLSLLGIFVYWIKHRASKAWLWYALFSGFACIITTSILGITLFYKFRAGGWLTIVITSTLIVICLLIKMHYRFVAKKLEELDSLLQQPLIERDISPVAIDPYLPTAIIFVNTPSVAMHTFLSIQRLFPNQFKNYVFLCAGAIDVESFSGQAELEAMQTKANHLLDYLVKFCYQHELAAEGYVAFGTDTINELKKLADTVGDKYPNAIFFASQLIFSRENMITRILHNQAPLILQHHLHFQGKKLMIIPMRI
ncbi:MAG: amino acid transporter [Gammaproteobacteria bacterium RIFCSPHIGHO2_12_FULL_37_34]|nr:MAG: amino acid transporter [Gammaproteobacteria bacterium RIFCSPHIGHO2_12_FULL_37_34]